MAPITLPRPSLSSSSSSAVAAVAAVAPATSSTSISNPTLPHAQSSLMPSDPIPSTSEPAPTQGKKRKRKEKPHVMHQCTYRKTTWTYFHLRLVTPGTATAAGASLPVEDDVVMADGGPAPYMSGPAIDPLTVVTLLTPPLTAYLGLMGSSIPIDILHTLGMDVWIRVPRQDGRAVRAGLMGWVGTCGGDLLPGVGNDDDYHGGNEVGNGRVKVKVAWRVMGWEEGRNARNEDEEKRGEYDGYDTPNSRLPDGSDTSAQ
ncbi:hypothetical protein K504DRAFT_500775 [Pleomassaria siparia CBS 279.74]|uniref:Ribonucleases P/MRP subunit Pop8-like domain-containing protein n=1 Tax=Pleomassaria siparia CBS 279.74 TaxID=1314801 RepID=A0A6G1KEC7_9PLEO|nr:hypothetical protein K504DRAFT_500775 [Pleomassaria siparia CBS 279.74]